MIKLFQLLKLCVVLLIGGHCNAQDYQLVWSDEFNKDGCLDESIWNYEQGYARNEELQWYQSDNAWCQGGLLVIEARSEKRKNPLYKAGSYDWRTSREYIECTSSSITTFGKKEFLYGRFEVTRTYSCRKRSMAGNLDFGKQYGMAFLWRNRYHGVLS